MATVLIVDDDVFFTRLVKDLVNRMGHRPVSVNSGQAALERARTEAPDLMITDMMMQPMDGLELCRRIRAQPATASLPVIMMSSREGLALRIQTADLGITALLAKPFDIPEMEARIRRVLSAREEAPPAGRLSGDLSSLELTVIVQGLNLQRKTGCLTIEGSEVHPEVKIWFEKGEVHSATSEAGEGREILSSLATRKSGRFVFDAHTVLPPDQDLRLNFLDVVLILGGDEP